MEGDKGKNRWIIPLTIVIVLFLGFSLYQWVIPRTNLEVRTVYHESPAGGGTGGSINLNVLLTNLGNREIESLDAMIIVRDHEGKEVARNSADDLLIKKGNNAEIKILFIGTQYKSYSVDIDIDFVCSGNQHSGNMYHTTVEDQMNLVFVDNIR